MRRGLFIVLEGPDKAGKSTQASRLVSNLRRRGVSVLCTREPGGASFSEVIRRILLDSRHEIDPLAELLLYEAARAQHTSRLIKPALAEGKIVVCDRYTLATEAYQGHGRGLPIALIRKLNRLATGGLKPDLTFLLDVPAPEFKNRRRKGSPDRMERESLAFRERVRQGYLAAAKKDRRVVRLDGGKKPDELEKEIFGIAMKRKMGNGK